MIAPGTNVLSFVFWPRVLGQRGNMSGLDPTLWDCFLVQWWNDAPNMDSRRQPAKQSGTCWV